MIRRSRFNFCQALFCFIVALMVMPVGFCAAQPKHSSDWAFGYEAFNLLLQESNIEICSQQEWNNTPGTDKFAIIIDDDPNIDWGPTMGGIPSLVMRSSGLCLKTRFRPRLGSVDSSQTQDFYSAADCPIVRPDSTHDVFFGVQSLVCNTPGYIAFPLVIKRSSTNSFIQQRPCRDTSVFLVGLFSGETVRRRGDVFQFWPKNPPSEPGWLTRYCFPIKCFSRLTIFDLQTTRCVGFRTTTAEKR